MKSRGRRLCGIAPVGLAAVVAACVSSALVRAGEDARDRVSASLEKIEEIRRVQLAADCVEEPAFDFNPPRLEMTFAVEPPPGATVSAIDQPSRIKAVDSAGKDLTNIRPGFADERQFVSLVNVWGEAPDRFTFRLAPPARGAKTFSLDAVFSVWVFDELKELAFEPTHELVEMTVQKLGNQKITAQLENVNGTTQLTITPGTVKRYVENIEFTDGKNTLQSHGTMWNDDAVTFMFHGTPTPGMQAKVSVRAGLRKLPCRVQLTNQILP